MTILIRNLRAFFTKSPIEKPKHKKPRTRRLSVEGQHYNLKEIFDRINEEYFDRQVNLTISWFGSPDRAAKRRRLLGSYCHREQLVKINRLLDQPHFPPYFISFIVYHEMLHHVHPPLKKRRGRRQIHHGEFKERERQFREYALVQKWEKENRSKFFTA